MSKKYSTSSMDAIRKKQQEYASRKKKFWTAEEGKNLIRLLPPRPGQNTFYFEGGWHYGLGQKYGFACNKTFGKKCKICLKAQAWLDSSSARKQKMGAAIQARPKILANIVDLNHKQNGVQVATLPNTVLEELLVYYTDAEYGRLDDPKEGFDIIIEREGKGLATRYKTRLRREPSAIHKKYLKKMHDLSTILKPYKKSDVGAALRELETGETDQDDCCDNDTWD